MPTVGSSYQRLTIECGINVPMLTDGLKQKCANAACVRIDAFVVRSDVQFSRRRVLGAHYNMMIAILRITTMIVMACMTRARNDAMSVMMMAMVNASVRREKVQPFTERRNADARAEQHTGQRSSIL